MKNKNIKTFEEYQIDYELAKDFDTSTIINSEIESIYKRKYDMLYLDYLLMKDVVNGAINESVDDVVISINKNDFENDPNKFYQSYNKSKRVSYLTPYTVEDLKEFNLFKVRGYNIGFAVKKNGDIILVHNNEKIKGIGDLLIKKAIEFGGDHLDHFDGFLTGFYKRNGFKLNSNDIFNQIYAPKDWKYNELDIYDPNYSIYAGELKVSKNKFISAEIRYENGMPDVVYRKFI